MEEAWVVGHDRRARSTLPHTIWTFPTRAHRRRTGWLRPGGIKAIGLCSCTDGREHSTTRGRRLRCAGTPTRPGAARDGRVYTMERGCPGMFAHHLPTVSCDRCRITAPGEDASGIHRLDSPPVLRRGTPTGDPCMKWPTLCIGHHEPPLARPPILGHSAGDISYHRTESAEITGRVGQTSESGEIDGRYQGAPAQDVTRM